MGLASLNSGGQDGRLEIPSRVGVAVLSLKAVWRQNSLLLRIPESFLLRLSTDLNVNDI